MSINIKRFNELSLEELYAILKLRSDVFVVEQQCAYEECDNQDQKATHFLVIQDDILVAYCRVLFEKDSLHIGRIVVLPSKRHQGLATELIKTAISYCQKLWPDEVIYISAQSHLEAYYNGLGFETISGCYDWDGIDHVDMRWTKTSA